MEASQLKEDLVTNWPVNVVARGIAFGAGGLAFDPRVKSDAVATAATFLCCPNAQPR